MTLRKRKRSLWRSPRGLLVLIGSGAVAMYFFDPQLGRTRRAKISDQLAGRFRRGARKAERAGRYMSAEAYGVRQKIAHAGSDGTIPPNDQALVAKIESEILRRADYPKGAISINAEDGVVFLRGELADERLISELDQDVRKVTGVIDVRNLLHLPGQPAPNKQPARQTSR